MPTLADLTLAEIDQLEAGAEMDALVAEALGSVRPRTKTEFLALPAHEREHWISTPTPPYSTAIKSAKAAADAMCKQYGVGSDVKYSPSFPNEWAASFWGGQLSMLDTDKQVDTWEQTWATGRTEELARCRATLKLAVVMRGNKP